MAEAKRRKSPKGLKDMFEQDEMYPKKDDMFPEKDDMFPEKDDIFPGAKEKSPWE